MWRILPVYLLLKISKHKDRLNDDIEIWINNLVQEEKQKHKRVTNFGYCIMTEKAFRNVIQNRLHRNPVSFVICRMFFPPLNSLYINMPPENIGGGLYFQHGFSTVVAAKAIGKNCSINQQVTIGHNGKDAPIIGNNVCVTAGAIVIGKVTVHDNAYIAAGAVVTKDVPANAIAAGVPAKVIKYQSNS